MELFCSRTHSVVKKIIRLAVRRQLLLCSSNAPSTWSCRRHIHSTYLQKSQYGNENLIDGIFTNPIDRLQPLLEIPIIPDSDFAFKPTRAEMEEAFQLFQPKGYQNEVFTFLGSYPNPHIMPKWDVPELCFIGRSNVGKSSLLAAMFAQAPNVKVKVSKKPGHTKLMNVFNVNNLFHLVDMPGYGFNMPDHFETSVEAYLKSRRSKMNFILFDGSVGMTNNDQKYFKRYSDLHLPLSIVLTKIDLATPSKLLRSIISVLKFRDQSKANSCFPQPFLVSSVNGEGLACLQSFIAYLTGKQRIASLS